MGNIWFTSDHHFFHDNICKLCNRPFPSVEVMNETMIERWNSRIKNNDTVYHLGDLFMLKNKTRENDRLQVESILLRLNGKITLIRGNHDKWLESYPVGTADGSYGADVSNNTHLYLEIKHYKQKICLFHYQILDWNGRYKGTWHLYGHSHNTSSITRPNSLNVCVENTDYYPLSFEEIKSLINQR